MLIAKFRMQYCSSSGDKVDRLGVALRSTLVRIVSFRSSLLFRLVSAF